MFPLAHFIVYGYHAPYRADRDDKGDELILFIRDYIECLHIPLLPKQFEIIVS